MPRFVLLRHECPPSLGTPSHWDLMLEAGASLATWRLSALPTPGKPVAAIKLADHRIVYLEYEGAVSGGRGEVRREDEGTYSELERTPKCWRVQFSGTVLSCAARLELRKGDAWTLTIPADPPAPAR